jgi:hypothetical protein
VPHKEAPHQSQLGPKWDALDLDELLGAVKDIFQHQDAVAQVVQTPPAPMPKI